MFNRDSTYRRDYDARIWTPSTVSVWGALTLFAAITGPFGTFSDLNFEVRLYYWASVVGVSMLVSRAIRLAIRQQFHACSSWQTDLASGAILIPVLSAIIWLLSQYLPGLPPEELPDPVTLLFYVGPIVVVITSLRILGVIPLRKQEDAAEEAAPDLPRILERLPEEIAGEIYRLSGQDHLVEVVTATGAATIRMRFADAIAEMEPVRGYCAHRSHWVSEAAIREVEREGAKIFLRLVNGDQVPVSRKYRPRLEEAGIL